MADKESQNNLVGTSTAVYDAMSVKWHLISALTSGTQAMRDAKETYLPREEREESDAYNTRLNRSFLFNGYRDSVEKIVAKPFSRSVVLANKEKLPEQLQGIEEDTDREGTSLTQLARELLTIAIDHGLAHVWVDYPRVEEQINLAEQRDNGIRPMLIPVSPASLIGWREDKDATGKKFLTQARIHEIVSLDSGMYGIEQRERVRVLNQGSFELFEKEDSKTGFVKLPAPEGEGDFRNFADVPIVTGYLARTGFMTAVPAMEDLAWMNLAHWQSSSDQRNILRFARTGLWVFTGITREQLLEQKFSLGPSSFVALKPKDADAKVVEHSGNAIDAGQRDLDKLEQQMQVLGLQPFFRLTGGATATEKMIDENRSETEVQAWIKVVEDMLYDAYAMAAKWIGQELPEDFAVNIYSNFTLDSLAGRDLEMLLKMRVSGNLDEKTFIEEVKRRNLFADATSSEEILARLVAEGPSLGSLGVGDEGGGEDEE
jgi:hypothetical protein